MRISDWSSDVCSSDLCRIGKKVLQLQIIFFLPRQFSLPKNFVNFFKFQIFRHKRSFYSCNIFFLGSNWLLLKKVCSMSVNALSAVSPIDGRYHRHTLELAPYFSEAAFMEYRVRVEVEYFIALCELPLPQLKTFKTEDYDKLRDITERLHEHDAREIKEIEKKKHQNPKSTVEGK